MKRKNQLTFSIVIWVFRYSVGLELQNAFEFRIPCVQSGDNHTTNRWNHMIFSLWRLLTPTVPEHMYRVHTPLAKAHTLSHVLIVT